MNNQPGLNASADLTLQAIRDGKLPVHAYISEVLDRCKRKEHLNTFITLLDEPALKAAGQLDEIRSRASTLAPLAGLAVAIKDNINVAGVPTTAGTVSLARNISTVTAPTAQKLIDAGAIVIGKTNLHELAMGTTGINTAECAGLVQNPCAPGKVLGGSSSGTAAAIAAGLVTCGLGTDTGGSVRIPAALTGTVGLRPSVGDGGTERRYHDDGQVVPLSRTRDTVGPMGRSVAEVALLDSVITGSKRVTNPASLSGVRMGIPPILWSGLDKSLEKVVLKAVETLKQAGVVFVNDDLPDIFTLGDRISFSILMRETEEDISNYLKLSAIESLSFKDITERITSPDVKPIFESIVAGTAQDTYDEAMTTHRPAFQQIYKDYFSRNNISAILFPTTILPATSIEDIQRLGTVSINDGPPLDAFHAYKRNTSPTSVAGLPGLSLPCGYTEDMLPVGIELDGLVGSDEALLGLGLALEQIFSVKQPTR